MDARSGRTGGLCNISNQVLDENFFVFYGYTVVFLRIKTFWVRLLWPRTLVPVKIIFFMNKIVLQKWYLLKNDMIFWTRLLRRFYALINTLDNFQVFNPLTCFPFKILFLNSTHRKLYTPLIIHDTGGRILLQIVLWLFLHMSSIYTFRYTLNMLIATQWPIYHGMNVIYLTNSTLTLQRSHLLLHVNPGTCNLGMHQLHVWKHNRMM